MATACALLCPAAPAAFAQAPGGGTRIVNAAMVDYRAANGATFRATSDTVVLTLSAAYALRLEPPRAAMADPGDSVVFPHTLINTGNAPDAHQLAAASASGWPVRFYRDINRDGRLDAGDAPVTAALPALASGDSASILAVLAVPASTVRGHVETVVVTATSTGDPARSAAVTDTITVRAPNVALTLAKAVSAAVATPGDALVYTLAWSVAGTGPATTVVVTDTIPAGTTFVPGSLTADGAAQSDAADADAGTYDAARRTVTFAWPSLAAGASGTLAFQVRVDPGVPATSAVPNTAHAAYGTSVGPVAVASNVVSTQLDVPALAFTKQLLATAPARQGDSVGFTIRYANTSMVTAARALVVTDTIPAGLAFVAAAPQATVAGQVVTWTIGDLAPGGSGALQLTTRVTWADLAPTSLVNVAAIAGINVAAGAAAAAPLDVANAAAAALDLDKTADLLEVSLGEPAPFTVAVRNVGTVAVADVVVADRLDEGMRFIPGTAVGADSVRVAGQDLTLFARGPLAVGDTLRLRYQVAVVSARGPILVNTAAATAAGGLVRSPVRTARLRIRPGMPMETRAAIGKVYTDVNGNGVQDAGEPGVEGVDVWSEDGEIATTDAEGRFSFRDVRTGRHSYRLDGASLPADRGLPPGESAADIEVRDASGWTTPRIVFRVVPRGADLERLRQPLAWWFQARPLRTAAESAAPRPAVPPVAVAAPASAATTVPAPVRAPRALVLRGVNFYSASARLTPSARALVQVLADTLRAHPDLEIEVAGHTDSVGTVAGNLDLSRRRAAAVRAGLEARGVPAQRLRSAGYGLHRPVASNATSAGRALNRRVELRVLNDTTGRAAAELGRALATAGMLRDSAPAPSAPATRPTRVVEYRAEFTNSTAAPILGARLTFTPAPDSALVTVAGVAHARGAGEIAIDSVAPGSRVVVLAWVSTAADSADARFVDGGGLSYALRAEVHNPLRPVRGLGPDGPLVSLPAAAAGQPPVAVTLTPLAGAWPDVAFRLPRGWEVEPGSARLDGAPVADPVPGRDRAGETILAWRFAGLARGPVTVRLRPAAAADAGSRVTVPALRSDSARAAEQRRNLVAGPAVAIFAPVDGTVSGADRLFVGVRGEPGARITLFDGDSVLGEAQLRGDGVHDFVALPLAEGPHRLRVRMMNSWRQARWDSAAVHVTGRPAGFERAEGRVTLAADGATTHDLAVRVRDGWGVPVVDRPVVTVEAEGAEVLNADDEPSSTGLQVRADSAGRLSLRLRGGHAVARGRVVLTAEGATDSLLVEVLPAVRPLMVTGTGRVGVGAAPRAFGALSARGRLDERTALTLSLDTRRLDGGRDVFGRAADPLDPAQYPILGDAGSQRTIAASRTSFAARLERGFDWIAVGDLADAFGEGLRLARYQRAVTGAAAHVTTGIASFEGFASATQQRLRQRQLRGEGISGPYVLDRGIRPGTEQVVIEARAADNAGRIVARQVLARWVDYDIDYTAGTLLLKRPVPAADPYGNPLFIVVAYEADGAGPRQAVWGLRSAVDATRLLGVRALDSVRVGGTWVRDHRSDGAFDLVGVDLRLVRFGRLDVGAEVARAASRDSTGFATALEAAWRLGARSELTARWSLIGREFRNPSNVALRGGTSEVAVGGRWNVAGATLRFEHGLQRFDAQGIARQHTTLGIVRPLGRAFELEGAVLADRTTDPATTTGQQGAEMRLRWRPRDGVALFAEGQLTATDAPAAGRPDYVGLGTALRLRENLTLEARHRRVLGGSGRGGYGVTDLATRTRLGAGTDVMASYQLAGVDGWRSAALVGVNNRLHLRDWTFSTMLERRVGLSRAIAADPVRALPFLQQEEDYWSAGFAVDLVPRERPWRASLRSELRNGAVHSTRLLGMAGDWSLSRAFALLSRQEFLSSEQALAGGTQVSRRWSTLWGAAFRPVRSDRLNALAKLEVLDVTSPAGGGVLTSRGHEGRVILATEAIWAPARTSEFAVRLAARRTRAELVDGAGQPQELRSAAEYVGVRGQHDVIRRAGVRVEGRLLVERRSATARWDLAPQLYLRPVSGIEVAAGVRVGDLRDPDFAAQGGSGFFLTLGAHVTERTMQSVADYWRERF